MRKCACNRPATVSVSVEGEVTPPRDFCHRCLCIRQTQANYYGKKLVVVKIA